MIRPVLYPLGALALVLLGLIALAGCAAHGCDTTGFWTLGGGCQ